MSDDLLERAVSALREESAVSDKDLAETRARLLASSRTTQVQRARALRWVLPLAAAFVAGSAFAATNGQIERAVRALSTWISETPEPAAAPAKKNVRSKPPAPPAPHLEPPAPAVVEAPQVPAAMPELAPSEAPAPEPQVAPAPAKREARAVQPAPEQAAVEPQPEPAPAAAPETEPAPRPHVPSPDLALYREAHRLHFGAKSYAEALPMWDRYLATFPQGIFALEARYNRAICLVRLGRTREARLALAPFAAGEVANGYRRDEARTLLDALAHEPDDVSSPPR